MLQLFQVNSSCTWYTSSVLGMLQLYQVCSSCAWYASNYNRTFLALMSQAPPSSKTWLLAQTLLLHVRSNSQKETQPNNFNSSTSTSKSEQKFTRLNPYSNAAWDPLCYSLEPPSNGDGVTHNLIFGEFQISASFYHESWYIMYTLHISIMKAGI